MISLGSVEWGSSPIIPMTFEYEKERSGANMRYRVKVSILTIKGGSYFGYPIYMALTIDGKAVSDVTLKAASPSKWSSAITYTSDWYTVSNKISGTTTVAFKIYSGLGSTRNKTYTYVMDVDPAASVLSVSNGTLGTKLSLSVTRYNTGFKHTITYQCGTAAGVVCTKSTATTVDWTEANGNTLALASQDQKNPSVSVTFLIVTHSGDTLIGSNSVTISMAIPDTVVPSVTLNVEDETGLFDTYGAYVQGRSKLKITATPKLAYGSPITTYAITADGKSYSDSPVITDVIQGKDTLTVTAKVTDARSRPSEEVTEDITVLEYSKPSVTAIAYRCNSSGEEDPEGAYMRVGFESTIASLNNINSAKYTIDYGRDPIEGTGTSFLSDPIECSVTRVWSVEVKVDDDLDSTTKAAVIPIAFTLMDFYHTGEGVSLGKVATRNGFDCAMTAYFTGGVYVDGKTLAKYITDTVSGK